MKRILLILPFLVLCSCSALYDEYEICIRNSSGSTITCEVDDNIYSVGDQKFSEYQNIMVDEGSTLSITINGTETFELDPDQPKRFIISIFRTGQYYDYVIDEPIDAHVAMTVDGTAVRYDGATLLAEESGKYITRFYMDRDDILNNLVEINLPGVPQVSTVYNYALCQSAFFKHILFYSTNEYVVAADSDFSLQFTSIDAIRGTYSATFSGTLSQNYKTPVTVTNGYITGYYGK